MGSGSVGIKLSIKSITTVTSTVISKSHYVHILNYSARNQKQQQEKGLPMYFAVLKSDAD